MRPRTVIPDQAIRSLFRRLRPDAEAIDIVAIGADPEDTEQTHKDFGYGRPLRVTVHSPGGTAEFVFHTAAPGQFGHDRRADRAAEMLLAYDTFDEVDGQAQAVDVGAVDAGGALVSLGGSGEFYLVSAFLPGTVYADDLRRIARAGAMGERDRRRVARLARHLAARQRVDAPALYRRSVRDLLGDGEGIFGIVDGYPADAPGAPPARLQAIEARCLEWRWRLRAHEDRLVVSHGDFHPFNLLFDDDDRLGLLDASRGCRGDPADDLTCLAINYPFFALEAPGAWAGGLRELWWQLWRDYLDATGDRQVLEVAAPYLAWRGLVLANPTWYSQVSEAARDRLLTLVERVLDAPRFDPEMVEDLFEGARS